MALIFNYFPGKCLKFATRSQVFKLCLVLLSQCHSFERMCQFFFLLLLQLELKFINLPLLAFILHHWILMNNISTFLRNLERTRTLNLALGKSRENSRSSFRSPVRKINILRCSACIICKCCCNWSMWHKRSRMNLR